jgi:hypothetical protein
MIQKREDIMVIKLNETYQVATGIVTLSVLIGNAQLGFSQVRLDNNEIKHGDIKDIDIGNGPDLIGKTLTVKTPVFDVSNQTNVLTVRYILKGGLKEKTYNLQKEVSEEGGGAFFFASFEFKS